MATKDTTKPTLQQSLNDVIASVRAFTTKVAPHLGFLYLSFVLGSITVVVYIVSQTLQSSDIDQTTTTNAAVSQYDISFDKATISKVQALSNNNAVPSAALPTGRINPFSESVY